MLIQVAGIAARSGDTSGCVRAATPGAPKKACRLETGAGTGNGAGTDGVPQRGRPSCSRLSHPHHLKLHKTMSKVNIVK